MRTCFSLSTSSRPHDEYTGNGKNGVTGIAHPEPLREYDNRHEQILKIISVTGCGWLRESEAWNSPQWSRITIYDGPRIDPTTLINFGLIPCWKPTGNNEVVLIISKNDKHKSVKTEKHTHGSASFQLSLEKASRIAGVYLRVEMAFALINTQRI